MATVICPDCDAEISIPENPMIGEIVECEECSAELEIVALNPLTVAEAPEVEEDWGE